MDISYSLLAIIILLAANGFFVAAEFALVKARVFRIETLAAEGSRAARLTLKIQKNLEAYLAACQLGITMASLGLGWVGEPAVAAMLEPLLHGFGLPDAMIHTIAFVTGFLVFSSLHIVIGEQVPKTLAIRKAEPISLFVAYPLHWAYIAVYPLNWALNRTSGLILTAMGVAETSHGDVFSGEEIKGLVTTSQEHGQITQDKAAMLHNLFEFDQRLVGRVMIPLGNVESLDISGEAQANLTIIRETGHSRFPVIDSARNDAIVGILLVKDIHTALLNAQQRPWETLADFVREPLIVPEAQRVSELFDLMRQKRAHMAFVIDEYGQMSGIVTLEDLLEEIVGEIHDETDDDSAALNINQIDTHCWEADGLLSLSDLERETSCKIEATLDANTLSGMFMARLARMPEVGDQVKEGAWQFTVQTIYERRVGKVLIEQQQSIEDKSSEKDV